MASPSLHRRETKKEGGSCSESSSGLCIVQCVVHFCPCGVLAGSAVLHAGLVSNEPEFHEKPTREPCEIFLCLMILPQSLPANELVRLLRVVTGSTEQKKSPMSQDVRSWKYLRHLCDIHGPGFRLMRRFIVHRLDFQQLELCLVTPAICS